MRSKTNKSKRDLIGRDLIGRDPTKGMLAFKTGAQRTVRDKLRNRNSRMARTELRRQLDNR